MSEKPETVPIRLDLFFRVVDANRRKTEALRKIKKIAFRNCKLTAMSEIETICNEALSKEPER